jgi:tRNA modification GTPase
MIVRVAGPEAHDLLRRVAPDAGAGATACSVIVEELPVPGLVLRFDSPRSYTGEDAFELHLPSSPPLAAMVLERLHALGARPAEPGEFTARAYLSGKLTLAAAEGVAAAIEADNAADLRAARGLMAGALADRLRPIMDRLVETLALLEAGIDFAEEDIDFITAADLRQRLDAVAADLKKLAAAEHLDRKSPRPRVVLAGRPNAGKSTLFNALLGRDRAVVSPVAGTTRDVLGEALVLPGGVVELIDAAGLDDQSIGPPPRGGGADPKAPSTERSAPSPRGGGPIGPSDIDNQVAAHAHRAIAEADVLVLVQPINEDAPTLPAEPDLAVRSKDDAGTHGGVSAHTGHGLADLRQTLSRLAFGKPNVGFALNARHRRHLANAAGAVGRAGDQPPELTAAELRTALDELGLILGEVTPDDVLGEVFGRFCIGK